LINLFAKKPNPSDKKMTQSPSSSKLIPTETIEAKARKITLVFLFRMHPQVMLGDST
jgi:hypothetical protein